MIAALILLSAVMAFAWVMQWRTASASWVDMCWTYGVGLACVVIALVDLSPHRMLLASIIAIWSLRLGTAIALRSYKAPEDPRYAKFRRQWVKHFQIKMFLFLQLQALVAWPLLFGFRAAAGAGTGFGARDVVGAITAVIAIAGETTADAQLRQFRASRKHSVCDAGLWSWSRHPNYFFEFLLWCALPCFAAPAIVPMLIACAAPLTIDLLLAFVSGIPPLEAHMLATRGDSFRAYQARTSSFFPWPPKKPLEPQL